MLVVVNDFGRRQHLDLPGSSTVEITLHPDGNGTIVRLRHDRLPSDVSREQHAMGWRHYLERLAIVADGGDTAPTGTTHIRTVFRQTRFSPSVAVWNLAATPAQLISDHLAVPSATQGARFAFLEALGAAYESATAAEIECGWLPKGTARDFQKPTDMRTGTRPGS